MNIPEIIYVSFMTKLHLNNGYDYDFEMKVPDTFYGL